MDPVEFTRQKKLGEDLVCKARENTVCYWTCKLLEEAGNEGVRIKVEEMKQRSDLGLRLSRDIYSVLMHK